MGGVEGCLSQGGCPPAGKPADGQLTGSESSSDVCSGRVVTARPFSWKKKIYLAFQDSANHQQGVLLSYKLETPSAVSQMNGQKQNPRECYVRRKSGGSQGFGATMKSPKTS